MNRQGHGKGYLIRSSIICVLRQLLLKVIIKSTQFRHMLNTRENEYNTDSSRTRTRTKVWLETARKETGWNI
jgi:hypothetical protein